MATTRKRTRASQGEIKDTKPRKTRTSTTKISFPSLLQSLAFAAPIHNSIDSDQTAPGVDPTSTILGSLDGFESDRQFSCTSRSTLSQRRNKSLRVNPSAPSIVNNSNINLLLDSPLAPNLYLADGDQSSPNFHFLNSPSYCRKESPGFIHYRPGSSTRKDVHMFDFNEVAIECADFIANRPVSTPKKDSLMFDFNDVVGSMA